MEQLRPHDVQVLLTCIQELATISDLDTFPTQAMAVLRKVVPALHSSYNEVNPRKRRLLYLLDSPDADFLGSDQLWLAHMHEHPLVADYQRTRDGQARKISDFLNPHQFTALGLYQELYRRFDTRHQMSITLPSAASLTIAFVLNRDRRDFTERDRLILNLLRPHLIQAYRNAETLSQLHQENMQLRHAVEESARGVIMVNTVGRMLSRTEQARRWLETYCGRLPHAGDWLPVEVRRWFLQQRTQWTQRDNVPLPSTPLMLEQEGRQLHIRLLMTADSESHMLLLEEQTTQLDPSTLATLGLDRREAEVLYWLIQGKTNPEIGSILQLRPSTVQTHLLRIYQKLGVETRVAAAMQALESLGLVRR